MRRTAYKTKEIEKIWLSKAELKAYLDIKDSRTLDKLLEESEMKIKVSVISKKIVYFLKSSVDKFLESRIID